MKPKEYQSWCTEIRLHWSETVSQFTKEFQSNYFASVILNSPLSFNLWFLLHIFSFHHFKFTEVPLRSSLWQFFIFLPRSSPFKCCSAFWISFRKKGSFHTIQATALLLSFLPFIFFIIMFNRMNEHYRFLLNKEIYNKNRKLRWH